MPFQAKISREKKSDMEEGKGKKPQKEYEKETQKNRKFIEKLKWKVGRDWLCNDMF